LPKQTIRLFFMYATLKNTTQKTIYKKWCKRKEFFKL